MAQYLKDDIQERIARAALAIFSERGFSAATMSEIAKRAGVATGNLYRYYENKSVLYGDVVPDTIPRKLKKLLRSRVDAAKGRAALDPGDASNPYGAAAQELLAFCFEHRLAVIVLLGRAAGSKHEPVRAEVVSLLVDLALLHFRGTAHASDPTMRFTVTRIYESFVGAMVAALVAFPAEPAAREAIDAYSRYHLSGLRALFEVRA